MKPFRCPDLLCPANLRRSATGRARAAQGQPLGKLGHSGDSNAPHVHYQLMAGPDIDYADALPCAFSNVDQAILDRGTYFEAR